MYYAKSKRKPSCNLRARVKKYITKSMNLLFEEGIMKTRRVAFVSLLNDHRLLIHENYIKT